ncbi:unnamed protein product [Lathyrus sativus]|nr:unnamed protein product [Lathyrus sativus]
MGNWGDFNAVKSKLERKGKGRLNFMEMKDFSSFIDAIDLVDMPIVGNRFTWFNSSGTCKSRLERILLSEKLVRKWKVVAQKMGDKDVLDHRLVWLLSNSMDWGPKPFKTFHAWFDHSDFIKLFKESWQSIHVYGNASNILVLKLKGLKHKLWWWNKHVFYWLDLKIIYGVDNLNSIERDMEDCNEDIPEEVLRRRY